MEVLVSAPSRLHVTLCDLGRATPRAYGGVGFAIREPRSVIRVRRGEGRCILPFGCDDSVPESLSAIIGRLELPSDGTRIDIEVQEMPPQHTGLGTKTAILLATILGANELLQLKLSRSQMQCLSGRGGTSGVGIHSFFNGGIVWDAGHSQSEIIRLGPSRYHEPAKAPPCLAQLAFPEDWIVCLLDVEGAKLSGNQELNIFERLTPLPVGETLELMGWVTHGLIPAFAERDLAALAESLTAVSRVGFKAREIAEQSASVQSLLNDLQGHSIAAGMSSLGSTIFALAGDEIIRTQIEAIARAHEARWLWTQGDNTGAVVSLIK